MTLLADAETVQLASAYSEETGSACKDDLDFDVSLALGWFPHRHDSPYVLVEVDQEDARAWIDNLALTFRRCYVTDALLRERAEKTGKSLAEILAAGLPDPGSTMAGDFGEILVYLYQAVREYPVVAFGPKKWRLKQDRTKPAPYSDVVQFVLPTWPVPSSLDIILCSEVKTKSTHGDSAPIKEAIEGSTKDRTSRLARTLVWLRDRALLEDLGDVSIAQLERFIDSTDYSAPSKRFRAVAVVCSSLLAGELGDAPAKPPRDYELVVISVPELHRTYNALFCAARESCAHSSTAEVDGEPM